MTSFQQQRTIGTLLIIVGLVLFFLAIHDLLWRIALIAGAILLFFHGLRLRGQPPTFLFMNRMGNRYW